MFLKRCTKNRICRHTTCHRNMLYTSLLNSKTKFLHENGYEYIFFEDLIAK